MFRLLSKKTNLFSVPTYIGALLLFILISNDLEFTFSNIFSTSIAFVGLAMGYVLFNKISLNRKTHLPLFLYSIFIFSFYDGNLDVGISMALFTNSILLFFFTNEDDRIRKDSFLLIGNILAVSYIFLPTTWTLFIFVIIHIITKSDKIFKNIFQLVLGCFMVILGYACLMYLLEIDILTEDHIPLISNEIIMDFSSFYNLIPILVMCILAVGDHFMNLNKKSPTSKFKYAFLLSFLLVQILILVFYMGSHREYLLLVIFPISIILSRFLRFLKYPWLQELGFWIIIISCLLDKFNPNFINLI